MAIVLTSYPPGSLYTSAVYYGYNYRISGTIISSYWEYLHQVYIDKKVNQCSWALVELESTSFIIYSYSLALTSELKLCPG